MTAARTIDLAQLQAAAASVVSPASRKARLARLQRPPEFPPAEVTHRRPIEPEPMTPDPGRASRLAQRAGLLIGQEIGRSRAERNAAEMRRVRATGNADRAAELQRMAAEAGVAGPDRGTDGAAMAARPSDIVEARVAGERAEDVRRMLDDDPIQLMGLTPHQLEAAEILSSTYREALPAMELPGGYGNGGRAGQRHLTYDQYQAAQRAWHDYDQWMGLIRKWRSTRHENAVRDAVVLREPAASWRVQEGLEVLAQHWGLAGGGWRGPLD
ncbi:hypothetical protein [Roseomonas sp. USHLN139]|uniref:hypothetical protein n=1 Tax=Roseomonas sp. USHLN139 TaxID=3081298 RepID=UPI003B02EB9E